MRKLIVFSAITLLSVHPMVKAELSDWQYCDIAVDADFLPYVANPEQTAVDVKADDAQLVEQGTSVFSGNVVVTRGGQELQGDRATYNQTSGDVAAKGSIRLRDSEIILKAEQAEWSLSQDKGSMIDAEYRLRESHARGEASHVFRQGTSRTNLKNATYTTCPVGNNAWLLEAANVNLDHQQAVGTAKDVVIRLGGLPIFYTPYISFPLNDDRKSGLLIPSIGHSDETGFDLSTPYYWNIAPNMDATITPRYMSERGLQLNGEFRYLYEGTQGQLNAGFLANDDLRNDGDDINPYYDKNRKHFSLQQRSKLFSNWKADIDYNYVSDDAYLEDFGSTLSLASTTHLNRRLNVGYIGDNWKFTGRLQGYQTLTDASKPYQRLPQLKLRGSLPDQFMGMTYGLTAEYVDFDHNDKIAGQRFDLEPSISFPWTSAAAFVTPRLALRHTRYDLDDNVTPGIDKTPTRTLPVVSVDSGLFFERETSFAGSHYTHTLEPRAFYLYIPERNQADIPVFDSSLRTFNMGQLFSYDRFSGTDRVGDANQLSLAVTSRFIDQQTGREKFRASIGQIRYFRDRDVVINEMIGTRSDSDFVAEIAASIAQEWSVRSEIQWNPHGNTSNLSALQLRYRGDNGQILNISHRYRRDGATTLDGLEQIDISARVPFNKQWSMVGRWYRSLKDARTLEGLLGIEYESCCWASRLVVRNYINDASDDDRNLAIFLQLELKGLGDFGQKTEKLLERSILGYGS
ncbi:MAG: LPS-assembly protein LptD [Methylophagaceae bacterium]